MMDVTKEHIATNGNSRNEFPEWGGRIQNDGLQA
jgi:hypothetical protein